MTHPILGRILMLDKVSDCPDLRSARRLGRPKIGP